MVRIYVTKNLQCGKKNVVWAPTYPGLQKKGTIVVASFCLMTENNGCYTLKRKLAKSTQQITIKKQFVSLTKPDQKKADEMRETYMATIREDGSFEGSATCKPPDKKKFKF